MNLPTAFQLVGLLIISVVIFFIVCVIITSSIKQLILVYFAAKLTYAQELTGGHASDKLADFLSKLKERSTVGKDS